MTLFEYGAVAAFFLTFFVWSERTAPKEIRSYSMAIQFGLFWPVTLVMFTLLCWYTKPEKK